MALLGASFNSFNSFQWGAKSSYPPMIAQRSQSASMINWAGVCGRASAIRGVACRLESINFGGVNMIRRIAFDDDVQWVVRIPMPHWIIGDDKSFTIQTRTECWNEEQGEKMKSEVYTMIYIRDHSDIPVPEIFDFDITPNNPLGAPYIFMECVMGNSITDLSGEFKVPEQYSDKLNTAIAKFQVFLESYRNSLTRGRGDCQLFTSIKLAPLPRMHTVIMLLGQFLALEARSVIAPTTTVHGHFLKEATLADVANLKLFQNEFRKPQNFFLSNLPALSLCRILILDITTS